MDGTKNKIGFDLKVQVLASPVSFSVAARITIILLLSYRVSPGVT